MAGMAKRKSLPWQVSRAVAERGDYRCWYCGINLLTCERGNRGISDHVLPVARGGTNEKSNLVNACYTCNSLKRALTLEEYREAVRNARGLASVKFFGEGERDVTRLCMYRNWRTFPERRMIHEAPLGSGLLTLNYDGYSLDMANTWRLPRLRMPPSE